MAAEQLPLLERPEIDADGMASALLLPDDFPELRTWIDEAIGWCEGGERAYARRNIETGHSEINYDLWPHAWVLRDLVAALPDALGLVRFAGLVETRRSGQPVDAREVSALIAAAGEATDAGR